MRAGGAIGSATRPSARRVAIEVADAEPQLRRLGDQNIRLNCRAQLPRQRLSKTCAAQASGRVDVWATTYVCRVSRSRLKCIAGVRQARAGMMRLVIKNTFYELEPEHGPRLPRRAWSAPPAIAFGCAAPPVVAAGGSSRRASAKLRRRRRDAQEAATLAEYAVRVKLERWAHLTGKLLAAPNRGRLNVLRAGQALQARAAAEPQFRLRLPSALFEELCHVVFESLADLAFLVRLGVVRASDEGIVELWSPGLSDRCVAQTLVSQPRVPPPATLQVRGADAPLKHPVMKSLLSCAAHIAQLFADCCFQVCVADARPIILRFATSFKMSDLRLALLLQGAPSAVSIGSAQHVVTLSSPKPRNAARLPRGHLRLGAPPRSPRRRLPRRLRRRTWRVHFAQAERHRPDLN